MLQTVRLLMLFEAMTFVMAALVHSGKFVGGYQHYEARIAETVIAVVLLLGLLFSWLRPDWARLAAMGAQGAALFGTLIGISTIIVGMGPRTAPDVIYHIAIIIVLAFGLALARRIQPGEDVSSE